MNDLKNRGAQDILIAVVARHAAHLLGRLDERFVNAGQGLPRRTRSPEPRGRTRLRPAGLHPRNLHRHPEAETRPAPAHLTERIVPAR